MIDQINFEKLHNALAKIINLLEHLVHNSERDHDQKRPQWPLASQAHAQFTTEWEPLHTPTCIKRPKYCPQIAANICKLGRRCWDSHFVQASTASVNTPCGKESESKPPIAAILPPSAIACTPKSLETLHALELDVSDGTIIDLEQHDFVNIASKMDTQQITQDGLNQKTDDLQSCCSSSMESATLSIVESNTSDGTIVDVDQHSKQISRGKLNQEIDDLQSWCYSNMETASPEVYEKKMEELTRTLDKLEQSCSDIQTL